MPRLIGSLRFGYGTRPLVASLVAIVLPPSIVLADGVATTATPLVIIQAVEPLPDRVVTAIAKLAVPTQLAKEQYPDAKNFSAKQTIEILCGSFRSAYWQETLTANSLHKLPPDRILGDSVYAIKWPACAYVRPATPGLRVTVKAGDTASDYYNQLTGGVGDAQTIQKFFRASGIPDVGHLQPGDILKPAHITLPTEIVPKTDVHLFTVAVANSFVVPPSRFDTVLRLPPETQKIAYARAQSAAPITVVVPRAAPRIQITAGKIASTGSMKYEDPEDCRQSQDLRPPFDAEKLASAYKYTLGVALSNHFTHSPASVTVVDNGFFGARPGQNGTLNFGPQFPSRFFFTSATYGEGQVGPKITSDDGDVYPVNYSNGLPSANFISGHGTHIAGLILGGPTFQAFLSLFDYAPNSPWLRIVILNIGKGGEYLVPNSASQLTNQLSFAHDSIFNLSLEYTDDSEQTIQSTFLHVVGDTSPSNLYVVAAGNDGEDVTDGPYYPASFGGTSLRNVITVAAHRPDGSLATFSNRGMSSVDLAAPGCDLASWLDETNGISRVSGTSQAAGVVTFAAALLKSIGGLAPLEIKNRLLISGDLLREGSFRSTASAGAANPRPEEVMSRSRLNIVKAMYVFDDYIRYHLDGESNDHVVLGTIQGITGFGCKGDTSPSNSWRNIWAYKAGEDGALLFRGRSTPTNIANAPCSANVSVGAMVYIDARSDVDGSGTPVPFNRATSQPRLKILGSSVREIVAALRPRGD